uniref:Uncharacterized protein n=1 Tax=Panagrolaimus superbus TaxID=310955 RepID=A0A914YIB7_9BILA
MDQTECEIYDVQHGLAAVLPGIGHQLRGTVVARHYVVSQDLGQLCLVLRLHQRIDRAGRQLVEGRIGGRENGEGAGSIKCIDQACGLDLRNQGRVVLGVDGVLDDGPGGIHLRSADHHGVGGEAG